MYCLLHFLHSIIDVKLVELQVIWCLICLVSPVLVKVYDAETKRTLRERFSEHRQATNNPLHVNAAAAVPSHFNLPGHSITDMGLIPLELQPTPSASRRKAREAYLIHRGQTISPDGINRRNEH